MADIISIGKILRDVLIESEELKVEQIDGKEFLALPYKEKITCNSVHFGVGGGAANSALSFAKLGKETAVIACVGNDPEGDEAINSLRMKFVNTDFVKKSDSQTGVSIILTSGDVAEKDHTVLIYRGANECLGTDLNVDIEFLTKAKGWYISSLGGNGKELLDKIYSLKTEGNFIAFNPGVLQINLGLENLKEILSKTEILILNKKEAEKFSEKTGGEMISTLKSTGAKLVCITEGKSGASVFDGATLYFGRAYESKAIEALGAGDAFGSTFFATWLDTKDIEKSLKYALVNSAAVLEKRGASEGLLSLQEIESKLKVRYFDIYIKSIL